MKIVDIILKYNINKELDNNIFMFEVYNLFLLHNEDVIYSKAVECINKVWISINKKLWDKYCPKKGFYVKNS
jgi:hypothetical protein